jgi:hypothetical protein
MHAVWVGWCWEFACYLTESGILDEVSFPVYGKCLHAGSCHLHRTRPGSFRRYGMCPHWVEVYVYIIYITVNISFMLMQTYIKDAPSRVCEWPLTFSLLIHEPNPKKWGRCENSLPTPMSITETHLEGPASHHIPFPPHHSNFAPDEPFELFRPPTKSATRSPPGHYLIANAGTF